ncbi:MAG: exosortase/archaeosortase family protein [Deltaproteobacteria bacterium]|nr:exosortase/archaeosortase family protein [Deltaproteobacteria bacterium]
MGVFLTHVLLNLLVCFVAGFVFFDAVSWLVLSWKANPTYAHSPLVIVLSVFLFCLKLGKSVKRGDIEYPQFSLKKLPASLPWLFLAIPLIVCGTYFKLNFCLILGLLFLFRAWLHFLYGRETSQQFNFPVFFPALTIPLPYLPEITNILQLWLAKLITLLLSALGYEMAELGSRIAIRGSWFQISPACVGFNSLIILLTLMILLIYLMRMPKWVEVTLMFLTLPIAMVSNFLRITLVLLISNYYGVESAMKYWHIFSGYFFYFSALLSMLIVWLILVRGKVGRAEL